MTKSNNADVEKKGKKEIMFEEVNIPEGVVLEVNNLSIKVKGKLGELERSFITKRVTFEKQDSKLKIIAKGDRKNDYKLIRTFKAHIKNMIKGVQEGFTYKLKICASHFPMKVSIKDNVLKVDNFVGEKHPRKLLIKPGVKVKIDGNFIIVESYDKEKAGQVAADIEQLTRIKNKDRRIFQDGIYIIEKAGKKV